MAEVLGAPRLTQRFADLLVAGLAQSVGASAAVGAFLVGIALPASSTERARVVLGPLATASVLVLAVAGPVVTRFAEPAALRRPAVAAA